MSTVCFTGHRIIKITDDINKRLMTKLEELIKDGADVFCTGGSVGWEMLCGQYILRLKKKYPHIRLKLILPCPAEEYTVHWTDKEQFDYSELLIKADEREIISEASDDSCIKKRNMRLIELADCCVCWYNESILMCGTAQTVRMANKKGIPVINLYS